MRSFDAWDIVKVPFPYTDRPVREWRPALVIASKGATGDAPGGIGGRRGLSWVLMITSAKNRSWPEDVAIADFGAAGLPAASVVRTAKIATIGCEEASKIGTLPAKHRKEVKAKVKAILARGE